MLFLEKCSNRVREKVKFKAESVLMQYLHQFIQMEKNMNRQASKLATF
jgi:hypothetical protein